MNELKDCANYLGMRQAATDEWDLLDIPDPPTIGRSFVNLYFEHQSWAQCPGDYSGDFKAINAEGGYFDFTVTAQGCRDRVTLQLIPETELPNNFTLYLLDLDRRTIERSAPGGEWTLPTSNGKLDKHYRLIVGTENFYNAHNLGIGTTPQSFALAQNYPNPFNPRTVISYQIPEPCHATLAIYNLLGQRVRTFALEEFKYPGYYQVTWNGESDDGKALASGVYWYSLRAGSFRQTKKMLFVK